MDCLAPDHSLTVEIKEMPIAYIHIHMKYRQVGHINVKGSAQHLSEVCFVGVVVQVIV